MALHVTLGFEWSIGDAAAGTFMDQLVHTWDLATTVDADGTLDMEVTEVCVTMFVPHLPDIERHAGIVGPRSPWPATHPAGAAARCERRTR